MIVKGIHAIYFFSIILTLVISLHFGIILLILYPLTALTAYSYKYKIEKAVKSHDIVSLKLYF
jgi:hypothetical protein